MNYYSDDLVEAIIERSEEEGVCNEIDILRGNTNLLFLYYARHMMNGGYVNRITCDEDMKFAYYCIDPANFSITSCPSAMAYTKVFDSRTRITNYYVLLICTKPNCRNLGYASALLDGFIQNCKHECDQKNARLKKETSLRYTAKIILSSVESAVTYYEHVGFKWTRKCLQEYPELLKYERYEQGKEYFMMEYDVEAPAW